MILALLLGCDALDRWHRESIQDGLDTPFEQLEASGFALAPVEPGPEYTAITDVPHTRRCANASRSDRSALLCVYRFPYDDVGEIREGDVWPDLPFKHRVWASPTTLARRGVLLVLVTTPDAAFSREVFDASGAYLRPLPTSSRSDP